MCVLFKSYHCLRGNSGAISFNSKGPFTRSVFQTVFISGTFRLFNVVCDKNKNTLNSFSNGPNNGLKKATCNQSINPIHPQYSGKN